MDVDLEKGPFTPENITAPLSKEDAV